jgi:hypothetical protein
MSGCLASSSSTATSGVHQEAFRQAVWTLAHWTEEQVTPPEVRVVGPMAVTWAYVLVGVSTALATVVSIERDGVMSRQAGTSAGKSNGTRHSCSGPCCHCYLRC